MILIATPGPGTYVAPSSFGYMLNSEQILAMSGVDLSPKLRDKLIYNQSSTNKSRRNSYSRHSNGLSQSQDRIRFRSRLSPKRAPSAPRPSSTRNNYKEN